MHTDYELEWVQSEKQRAVLFHFAKLTTRWESYTNIRRCSKLLLSFTDVFCLFDVAVASTSGSRIRVVLRLETSHSGNVLHIHVHRQLQVCKQDQLENAAFTMFMFSFL